MLTLLAGRVQHPQSVVGRGETAVSGRSGAVKPQFQLMALESGPSENRTPATRLKVEDSATELTAIGSESQHRTDDLPIMSRALWPTELSRHGWPPRSRTARYLLIRQAPSTGWVAAKRRWRYRAPLYSPERKTENSNPRALAPTRFPDGDHHLMVSSPMRGERATRTPRPEPRSR
jgi:hypothetical protein